MSEETKSTWKPDKNLSPEKRFQILLKTLPEIKEKHLRSLRNNLNNRIKSFKEESQFGSKAKELQLSHPLYAFLPGECEKLLAEVQKELRHRLVSGVKESDD